MSAPQGGSSAEVHGSASPGRKPWSAPQLVRMGTVATLTNKIDLNGRNDGGSGNMKRT